MRDAFADELLKLAIADPRIVLLVGDLGYRLFDEMAAIPGRFTNAGVAEQNMMGMAAGMAMSGLRPVVYSIAPFVTTRCFEQVRTDVCYHGLPVVIVGVGAGLSYADLGPSHHALEDIAIMRTLPGMQIVCPGDPCEARAALRCALTSDHPAYLRLGKRGEPCVHAGIPAEFGVGKAIDIAPWDDGLVCILACGTILPVAIEAARLLSEQGVCTPDVASFPWIKPLDEAKLREAFGAYDLVVTMEEHGLAGGLGSAVAEWASDRGMGQRGDGAALLRLGTPDRFHCEAGDQEHARRVLGLSAKAVAGRIRSALES